MLLFPQPIPAPPAPPHPNSLPLALPAAQVRWDRVHAARQKIENGDYDRVSDADLDSMVIAQLRNPAASAARSPRTQDSYPHHTS